MKKWLIGIIIVLVAALTVATRQAMQTQKKYESAMANVKAYGNMLEKADQKAVALQLTVDQIGYFRDSVLHELDETRKELRIKDKNLKALQAIQTTFNKKDTIIFRDTLFKKPTLALDTIIGDEWYTLKLGLKYPSVITVKPEFKSEKHIIVSSKKETVNPPKKFFLFRWFQRKMKVLHVNVVEKNPYIEEQTSKYVEIIK